MNPHLQAEPEQLEMCWRELEQMGRQAGFATVSVAPLLPSPQSLVVFE